MAEQGTSCLKQDWFRPFLRLIQYQNVSVDGLAPLINFNANFTPQNSEVPKTVKS